MSKAKNKVVDLEMGSDGTYTTKTLKNTQALVRNKPKGGKLKYVLENNADQFLGGIDLGLDFLDKIVPRVERFMRLRG